MLSLSRKRCIMTWNIFGYSFMVFLFMNDSIRVTRKCILFSVFITIFTNESKMKTFWYNLFQSYQLTPKNCHRLSHLMLAIFAPITYPAFEVLNLIKYTRRKLQLNEFLQNEKDLGRFRIHFLVLTVEQSLSSSLWQILKYLRKDLELPFSK